MDNEDIENTVNRLAITSQSTVSSIKAEGKKEIMGTNIHNLYYFT